MTRIAAPMVGGLASSFLLELIVYPGVYYLWKWKTEMEPRIFRRAPRGFWAFVAKIG
jgi:hypothetical protein